MGTVSGSSMTPNQPSRRLIGPLLMARWNATAVTSRAPDTGRSRGGGRSVISAALAAADRRGWPILW